MTLLTLSTLKETYDLQHDALKASLYYTKGNKPRLRLTNNKPEIAIVPAVLPYILKVNRAIKDYDNVSTHTTNELDSDNTPTGNQYRDLSLSEDEANGLH